MAQPLDMPPYHDWTVEERLALIGEIWQSIEVERQPLPLTDAHRAELDRRLAEHRAHPERAKTWEEVQAHIRARVRERHKKSA